MFGLIEKASKLIESFLLGLPVPQIFIYNKNEEHLVIDGQQRLKSINYFLTNKFPIESGDKFKKFKLKECQRALEWQNF